jgi:uncharacterized protein (TIGR00106 family)
MIMAELSIYPVGKGEHLCKPVSEAVNIIDKSGLNYKLTPMGTIMEGNWDGVFSTIKKCFEVLKENSDRLEIDIKVDYCKGETSLMEHKVKAVAEELGKTLKV